MRVLAYELASSKVHVTFCSLLHVHMNATSVPVEFTPKIMLCVVRLLGIWRKPVLCILTNAYPIIDMSTRVQWFPFSGVLGMYFVTNLEFMQAPVSIRKMQNASLSLHSTTLTLDCTPTGNVFNMKPKSVVLGMDRSVRVTSSVSRHDTTVRCWLFESDATWQFHISKCIWTIARAFTLKNRPYVDVRVAVLMASKDTWATLHFVVRVVGSSWICDNSTTFCIKVVLDRLPGSTSATSVQPDVSTSTGRATVFGLQCDGAMRIQNIATQKIGQGNMRCQKSLGEWTCSMNEIKVLRAQRSD